MVKVIYTVIMSFGVLREVFSDFGKKMLRRVETEIKCTEVKTSKKHTWNFGFSFFLDVDKKNL